MFGFHRTQKGMGLNLTGDLTRLHKEVTAKYLASALANPATFENLAAQVLASATSADAQPLSPQLHQSLLGIIKRCFLIQSLLRQPKSRDSLLSSGRPLPYIMEDLEAQAALIKNPGPAISAYSQQLVDVAKIVLEALPRDIKYNQEEGGYEVELLGLLDQPAQRVTEIIKTLTDGSAGYLSTLGYLLDVNLREANGLPPGSDKARAYPHERREDISQIAELYTKDTPLQDLLKSTLRLSISKKLETEHYFIVAGSGWGKTQQLLSMTRRIFDDPGKPGYIFIDSQGDTTKAILDDKRFAPGGSLAERLIVIDPSKVGATPAISLFSWKQKDPAKATAEELRDAHKNSLSTLEYVITKLLGAEFTPHQDVVFKNVCKVLLKVPGATLQTMQQLLSDQAPFAQYIATLDATAQAYFQTQYDNKKILPRRAELEQRIWMLLSDPTFSQVFSSPETRIDLGSELQQGKIVLINTAKDVLGENGCRAYGLYWIGLLKAAALDRIPIPEEDRRMTYAVIDEAPDYFDESLLPVLYSQIRKYRFSLITAQQALTQSNSHLREIQMANTAIRFIGGVTHKDATALAADCSTSADFLSTLQKDPSDRWAEYALYLRNIKRTFKVRLDYPYLNPLPPISASELTATLKRNEEKYYVTLHDDNPYHHDHTDLLSSPTRDDNDERNSTLIEHDEKPKTEHRQIQELLRDHCESLGLVALLEKHHKDKKCRVDLAVTVDEKPFAIQVSSTNKPPYEVKVLPTLLEAGYRRVVVVSAKQKHLASIEALARDTLTTAQQKQCLFFSPEAAMEWLSSLPPLTGSPLASPYTVTIAKKRKPKTSINR